MKPMPTVISGLLLSAIIGASLSGGHAQAANPGYAILTADVDTGEVTRFNASGEAE